MIGSVLVDFDIVRFTAGHAIGAADLLREALTILERGSRESGNQSMRHDTCQPCPRLVRQISGSGAGAGDPAVFWEASALVPMYEAWAARKGCALPTGGRS
jgi:hypothetical protein